MTAMFTATLVLVSPLVLRGSKEGQLRGTSTNNASDWNATSLSETKNNVTAPSTLRTTYSDGADLRFNADSRYCLSVAANWFRNGQNMQLWECSRSSGQLFKWNNGMIQVAQDPRFCVVVAGNQNRDGANIQLWECDPDNSYMRWRSYNPNGKVANSNGRCMVVDNNHAYNGANIQLWSCDGYESYKTWSIGAPVGVPCSTPSPTPPPLLSGDQFRFNADSKYCLSVDANQFRNGQNMQMWECSRSSGQLFTWNNGMIQVVQDPRFCVVIAGNQNRDGANIQLWECDSYNSHMEWNWYNGHNSYNRPPFYGSGKVVNFNDRCMVVDNNHAYNGANVQLWSCHDYDHYKKWNIGY